MDGTILPPELEQFAAKAIAAGRYRNMAEVLRAGVTLLQHAEAEMAGFVPSVEVSRDKASWHGCVSLDDMLAEMGQFIHETGNRSA